MKNIRSIKILIILGIFLSACLTQAIASDPPVPPRGKKPTHRKLTGPKKERKAPRRKEVEPRDLGRSPAIVAGVEIDEGKVGLETQNSCEGKEKYLPLDLINALFIGSRTEITAKLDRSRGYVELDIPPYVANCGDIGFEYNQDGSNVYLSAYIKDEDIFNHDEFLGCLTNKGFIDDLGILDPNVDTSVTSDFFGNFPVDINETENLNIYFKSPIPVVESYDYSPLHSWTENKRRGCFYSESLSEANSPLFASHFNEYNEACASGDYGTIIQALKELENSTGNASELSKTLREILAKISRDKIIADIKPTEIKKELGLEELAREIIKYKEYDELEGPADEYVERVKELEKYIVKPILERIKELEGTKDKEEKAELRKLRKTLKELAKIIDESVIKKLAEKGLKTQADTIKKLQLVMEGFSKRGKIKAIKRSIANKMRNFEEKSAAGYGRYLSKQGDSTATEEAYEQAYVARKALYRTLQAMQKNQKDLVKNCSPGFFSQMKNKVGCERNQRTMKQLQKRMYRQNNRVGRLTKNYHEYKDLLIRSRADFEDDCDYEDDEYDCDRMYQNDDYYGTERMSNDYNMIPADYYNSNFGTSGGSSSYGYGYGGGGGGSFGYGGNSANYGYNAPSYFTGGFNPMGGYQRNTPTYHPPAGYNFSGGSRPALGSYGPAPQRYDYNHSFNSNMYPMGPAMPMPQTGMPSGMPTYTYP